MRKLNIKMCIIALSLGVLVSLQGIAQESLPNIIYILADDMGYGDVGAYNPQSKIPTPNIDVLASNGMRFTDAHTSSSVCTPTRYGIFTGRYNWRSRLKSNVVSGKDSTIIIPGRTTVASLLQSKGYYTAYIGKWHMGWNWALYNPDEYEENLPLSNVDFSNIDFSRPVKNSPKDFGFDYSHGTAGGCDLGPYVYVENGKATMVPDSFTVKTAPDGSGWREGPISRDFDHVQMTPLVFEKAIKLVGERATESQPFFLYLPLPSPHTPILPTSEWKGKSGINIYADFVMMIDNYVGDVIDAVDKAGIEDNTIIIFTTDNGCSTSANFSRLAAVGHYPSYIYKGSKSDIYDGGHRVPFIVKWPLVVEKNSVSNATICLTDLLATAADISDYTLADDEGEDSYSILPLLTQDVTTTIREATVHHSFYGYFAIRKGDWKLNLCPGSGGWTYPGPANPGVISGMPPVQLYNMATDPGETTNLEADYPEIVNELKLLMTKYIEDGRSTPGTPQPNDPTIDPWDQINF